MDRTSLGRATSAGALELVRLTKLMERTGGRAEVKIGLIDGPVATNHPELAGSSIQEVSASGNIRGSCSRSESNACINGTFVAGILSARRGSSAPAIAPDCTLFVRPIFAEGSSGDDDMPSASPAELAHAIMETVDAGARVINLSAGIAQGSLRGNVLLSGAIDYAARRGAIVVAAAGNQSDVGSSAITSHRWVIPVAGCDSGGRPLGESNFGSSIGRRGLTAPAENIESLGPDAKPRNFGGTSAAAPFVTGALALLWSEFPSATATSLKSALIEAGGARRNTIVPPILDASAAYETMAALR